jgi:hypothetical protein
MYLCALLATIITLTFLLCSYRFHTLQDAAAVFAGAISSVAVSTAASFAAAASAAAGAAAAAAAAAAVFRTAAFAAAVCCGGAISLGLRCCGPFEPALRLLFVRCTKQVRSEYFLNTLA